MTDFMPADVREAADKIGSDFIKGVEFEGAGLVLQLVQPLEKITSRFGASDDNFLVKNEILSEGQTFRFVFRDKTGQERKMDTHSAPFFLAFKNVEELGVGDWVKIVRTGKTTETRYTVEKVDAPVLPNDYPENDLGEAAF